MIRLNIIVEGETEEAFVNQVLKKHLLSSQVYAVARLVKTSDHRGKITKGGMPAYLRVRKDITSWLKEDQNSDVHFTTMFDLYALSDDFPGFQAARKISGPTQRVESLEKAFLEDIVDRRFLPYFQLHEYEALLLSDPSKFEDVFLESEQGIENLKTLVCDFDSPEEIDDGRETAPSKRIIHEISDYGSTKKTNGPKIAKAIGLDKIRKACPHFNQWLEKLEKLSQEEN